MSFIYPGGDAQVTPNIGLATYGMDEVLAENMIIIDAAIGSGGSTVEVNGVSISNPNFNNTTPAAPSGKTNVIWQVDGSGNVSAYITTPAAAPVTSVFGRTGAVVATTGDYSVAQITGAAPLASPAFTGNPIAPTPITSDNSTSISTTAFVKAQGYITSSPVTSVFGRTGAVVAATNDYATTQINGMPASNGAVGQVLQSNGTSYFNNSLLSLPYVNPTFISAIIRFTGATTGPRTVYTVPANRRAVAVSLTLYNDTGSAANFQLTVNIGGTHYPVNPASASIAAGASLNQFPLGCPILEAGEIFEINNNAGTSYNVVVGVVEFDNTSSIRSVRIFSDGVTTAGNSGKIVNGDAIMYQVTSGKTAYILSLGAQAAPSSPLSLAPGTGFGYSNISGANRTIHFNIFANGGTAGNTNQITAPTTGTNATETSSGLSSTLGSQDCLSINCNSNAAGQMSWVNVIEI